MAASFKAARNQYCTKHPVSEKCHSRYSTEPWDKQKNQ